MIVDNSKRRNQERAWARICYATARSVETIGVDETVDALEKMLAGIRSSRDLSATALVKAFDLTAKKFR